MSKHEINRIIDQVERTYNGDCWPGSSTLDILEGVDEEAANSNQVLPGKSIHQVVRHILATELLVINRLDGIDYVLAPEEDWPPVETCAALSWEMTLNELASSKNELVSRVNALNDEDLDKPILPGKSSVYVTLHGHIQHNLYHYGQISLMKS